MSGNKLYLLVFLCIVFSSIGIDYVINGIKLDEKCNQNVIEDIFDDVRGAMQV